MLPAPVCAYDIAPDGTAKACALGDAAGDGWCWVHLDLAAEGLADWLDTVAPPAVANALMLPETRPRFSEQHGGALVNLRGVNLNPGADIEDMVGLRIWATPTLVITLRRRRVMAMDDLRAAAEAGLMPHTPSGFVAAVAEEMTSRIEEASLVLEDEVDSLEEAMVEGEAVSSHRILDLRQKLIKLKRFIGPQKDALAGMAKAGSFMDADILPHVSETANRAARTVEAIEAARDRMGILQEHIDARAASVQGRNGYILSIIAAIFLPLGFLTGLFGVNIAGMPGMETPWAFAALCLASAVLGLGLFLIFRWSKWL